MDVIVPMFMVCVLPVLWTIGVFVAGYVAGSRRVRFRSPLYGGDGGQTVAGVNGYQQQHRYYDALEGEEI